MINREAVEKIAMENGFTDFAWISGRDVRVSQWVRFKCMFGCDSFGKKGGCPPEVPSIAECREFFLEYDHILIVHLAEKLDNPDKRGEWSRKKNLELLTLEKATFLAGHHKAFLLFMDECHLCKDCPGTRKDCRNQAMARPCAEALGVDVFATVRAIGYPIEVLADYDKEMNRYAFLLVE